MDLIFTNLGPMTPDQAGDELEYRYYRNQRYLYGIRPESLALLYGDVVADRYEERYRQEMRGKE